MHSLSIAPRLGAVVGCGVGVGPGGGPGPGPGPGDGDGAGVGWGSEGGVDGGSGEGSGCGCGSGEGSGCGSGCGCASGCGCGCGAGEAGTAPLVGWVVLGISAPGVDHISTGISRSVSSSSKRCAPHNKSYKWARVQELKVVAQSFKLHAENHQLKLLITVTS